MVEQASAWRLDLKLRLDERAGAAPAGCQLEPAQSQQDEQEPDTQYQHEPEQVRPDREADEGAESPGSNQRRKQQRPRRQSADDTQGE